MEEEGTKKREKEKDKIERVSGEAGEKKNQRRA